MADHIEGPPIGGPIYGRVPNPGITGVRKTIAETIQMVEKTPPAPIADEFRKLKASYQDLTHAVNLLVDRITPVLQPEEENNAGRLDGEKSEYPRSPLERDLAGLADQVSLYTGHIQGVLNRVRV